MATYAPYSCCDSPREELIEEVIVQKTAGALSIIGSSYIVFDVLKRIMQKKGKKTDPYQRIMLGLSFSDITLSTFDHFMGTWMTPAESGWVMAAGNQASCTAQGFFAAAGHVGCIGYQMALSLNILLLISFEWNQKKFARRIEKPMHASICLITLVYAIIPLPLESYNSNCGQCQFAALYDYETGELLRGSPKLQRVYWTILVTLILIMIIFCTLAMCWVYNTVRRQENKMKRYSFQGMEAEEHHRESKRIRKILVLYTLSLLLCWGFPFITIFVSMRLGAWPDGLPFWFRAVLETLIPLVGFFNMLVYFLPASLKFQKDHRGCGLIKAYFNVLKPSVRCARKVAAPETPEFDAGRSSRMNFARFNMSTRFSGRSSQLSGLFNSKRSFRLSNSKKTSEGAIDDTHKRSGDGNVDDFNQSSIDVTADDTHHMSSDGPVGDTHQRSSVVSFGETHHKSSDRAIDENLERNMKKLQDTENSFRSGQESP